MSATVICLQSAIDARELKLWDAEARALGFVNFAALEAACDAEWDARFEYLQQQCTHSDKRQDIGMCERCAELLP
jgi:hypothetical protein